MRIFTVCVSLFSQPVIVHTTAAATHRSGNSQLGLPAGSPVVPRKHIAELPGPSLGG